MKYPRTILPGLVEMADTAPNSEASPLDYKNSQNIVIMRGVLTDCRFESCTPDIIKKGDNMQEPETYGYRITIYCSSQEQKDKIQSKIRNVKAKRQLKKTGDAAEIIVDEYKGA